jgi:hypothetical protein
MIFPRHEPLLHATHCGTSENSPQRAISPTLSAPLTLAEANMAGPGVNLATTKDGEAYNKLQRPPQHYLTSTAPPLPPTVARSAAASPVPPFKRKRDSAYPTPSQKRSRVEQEKGQGPNSLLVAAGRERVRDAASGMQIMLPGVDDEGHSSDGSTCDAIAYLRDVRQVT